MSPNSSLEVNLSSLNQFSNKFLRSCCNKGLDNSMVSNWFNPPLSNKVEKYYLTSFVDSHNTLTFIEGRGDEDLRHGDSVDEQVGTGFQVVKVDETILGQKVNNTVLLRNLDADWEIRAGIRWEEDIHVLLLERWVVGIVVDFNDVQLTTGFGSVTTDEDLGWGGGAFKRNGREGSNVTFNGLRYISTLREQLNLTSDTTIFLGDTNDSKPIELFVGSEVYDLSVG
ncbi:hypothetical protein WICPIJ_000797 [Wickerhamomyces pijperi]|uniref:Uncharacterized protein n=1 Tax=Wickerhamomyces pijperi TaxID=599730 RepID=A0A9P8QD23_WICPI|nr:hypothetical protein WICPIJ_000797 [Wickerhamomyces pijperi]